MELPLLKLAPQTKRESSTSSSVPIGMTEEVMRERTIQTLQQQQQQQQPPRAVTNGTHEGATPQQHLNENILPQQNIIPIPYPQSLTSRKNEAPKLLCLLQAAQINEETDTNGLRSVGDDTVGNFGPKSGGNTSAALNGFPPHFADIRMSRGVNRCQRIKSEDLDERMKPSSSPSSSPPPGVQCLTEEKAFLLRNLLKSCLSVELRDPSPKELHFVCQQTGLNSKQVMTWISSAKYSLNPQMVEETVLQLVGPTYPPPHNIMLGGRGGGLPTGHPGFNTAASSHPHHPSLQMHRSSPTPILPSLAVPPPGGFLSQEFLSLSYPPPAVPVSGVSVPPSSADILSSSSSSASGPSRYHGRPPPPLLASPTPIRNHPSLQKPEPRDAAAAGALLTNSRTIKSTGMTSSSAAIGRSGGSRYRTAGISQHQSFPRMTRKRSQELQQLQSSLHQQQAQAVQLDLQAAHPHLPHLQLQGDNNITRVTTSAAAAAARKRACFISSGLSPCPSPSTASSVPPLVHSSQFCTPRISPATGKEMLPYRGNRGGAFRFGDKAQSFMKQLYLQNDTPSRHSCERIAKEVFENYTSIDRRDQRPSWQQVRTWFKNRRFAMKQKSQRDILGGSAVGGGKKVK